MSNAVSNNTIGMRDWSKNIDSQADSYDELIRKLYTLVDQFANSEDFFVNASFLLLI